MLKISCSINQSVYVGQARIVILGLQNGQVRLGIDAPQDIPISRNHPNTENGQPI